MIRSFWPPKAEPKAAPKRQRYSWPNGQHMYYCETCERKTYAQYIFFPLGEEVLHLAVCTSCVCGHCGAYGPSQVVDKHHLQHCMGEDLEVPWHNPGWQTCRCWKCKDYRVRKGFEPPIVLSDEKKELVAAIMRHILEMNGVMVHNIWRTWGVKFNEEKKRGSSTKPR